MINTYESSKIELNFTVASIDELKTKETAINTYVTNRADGSYFVTDEHRNPDGSRSVNLKAYINIVDFDDFDTVQGQMNTWVGNNLSTATGGISYRQGFAPDPE